MDLKAGQDERFSNTKSGRYSVFNTRGKTLNCQAFEGPGWRMFQNNVCGILNIRFRAAPSCY